jgi:hypothetical protein
MCHSNYVALNESFNCVQKCFTFTRFGDFVDRIYPIELEIKDTTITDKSDSYLDLHL